jgi:hypothetical protein
MRYMKHLVFLVTLLVSCTNPQFVTLNDSAGNPIHTTTPSAFFNTPDKASEWGFWYVVIVVFVLWMVWREFKSVKWPKKKEENKGHQDQV